MVPQPRRLKWLPAFIWIAAMLLAAATWAAAIELSDRDRQETLARAERDSGNLTRIIAEQATRAFADTDRILSFLAFDLGRFGSDHRKLADVLKNATAGSNLLLQLSYTDASGDVLESSVDGLATQVNLADREHFLAQKQSDGGLFISRPVFGRASGKWSIQLSRRITAADGGFAGIMVASLDPFYFSHTFEDLNVGPHGLVAIIGLDGILRARTQLDDKTLGRDVSNTLPFRLARSAPRGFLREVSPVDGVLRLLSFRTVTGYPLIVVAGFDEAEFMAQSVASRRIFICSAAAATAMLLILAMLVNWQTRIQDRARETAEHANKVKSEFLTTVSHEIRTPMNGVLGMLTLLEGGDITPGQRRLAETARRSGEGLLVLLNNILDFSRLEAAKDVVEIRNCDPARVANAVADLFRPSTEQAGVTLSVRMGPSVPDAILTDPTRLRQILFNLVGNALKFTASGHIAVHAQRGADLAGGKFLLEFEVEDTGIGIAPEVIPALFRQFTQADNSITRTYGGTGLGLAICKRLCELLGGGISVSSTLGKGSVFRFTIAAGLGDATLVCDEPSDGYSAVETPSLPALNILVVDDGIVNQQVVSGLLVRAGHGVTAVDSGPAAIAALRASHRQFDLVLMDVQMPEMDGLTATRLIRALPPPFNAVPVIALTANASHSSRAVCLAAGMNGYASKPIRLRQLLDEIVAVIGPASNQPGTMPPDSPVDAGGLLDREQVAELTGSLSAEAWARVVASFSASSDGDIDSIISAIEMGQSPGLSAHSLKGEAWNTGARSLGDLARQLETAPPDEARRLAAELRPLRDRSVAALIAGTSSKPRA